MKKESLPLNAIKIFKLRAAIIMSFLSFLLGVITVFDFNLVYFLASVIIIIYLYLFSFYCIKRYKCERYYISYDFIYREKGVFLKKEFKLLTENIQYFKIKTHPIQQFWGLYNVNLYTAGGCEKLILVDSKAVKNIEKILQVTCDNEI